MESAVLNPESARPEEMRGLHYCQCGGLIRYDSKEAADQVAAVDGMCVTCGRLYVVALYERRRIGLLPWPARWDKAARHRINFGVNLLARRFQYPNRAEYEAAQRVSVRFLCWSQRRPWSWLPFKWQGWLFVRWGLNEETVHESH